METQEVIRFLKNTILWNLGDEAPIGKDKYQHLINDTIELLQRGEKFKEMWKELNVKLDSVEIYDSITKYKNKKEIKDYSMLEFVRLIIIKNIKQKYFPKEK